MLYVRALLFLGVLSALSSTSVFAQGASALATGDLEGQFRLEKRDGAPSVPIGTRVWIFYGPSNGCVVLGQIRGALDCHIELAADRFLDDEFACEQKSAKPMQQIQAELTQLKAAQTEADEHEKERLAGQLNGYYTLCGERAIEKTMAWAQKHSKEAWQTRIVVADDSGRWSASDLRAGHYIVVIRAHVSNVEAYSLDTDPPLVEVGKTATVRQLTPLLTQRVVAP
jgi:hypothetical protein